MITDLNIDTQNILITALLRIIGAVVVFIIGRWLAGFVQRSVRVILNRTHASTTLVQLLVRIAYYATMILAVLLALIVLGVPVNMALGVLGIVIVVAAVALRESLRDLAATVNFIVFQPFKVGDTIETNGITAQVKEIQLFTTVLTTSDNRQAIISNSNIQSSLLLNVSALDKVRLDLTVRLSYADDVQKVIETLLAIAKADDRVLETPEPMVQVMALGESQVEYVLHVYTPWDQAWLVRSALNQEIKTSLEQGRLTLPLPQLQLHKSSSLLLEQTQPPVEPAPR